MLLGPNTGMGPVLDASKMEFFQAYYDSLYAK